MNAARILIPGPYLDAYRADPHPDMPPAVHALLIAADTTGQGSSRHAALDVPAADVADMAAVLGTQFDTWGGAVARQRFHPTTDPKERAALALRARMAHHVLVQLQRHQDAQEKHTDLTAD